ncbi:hypothetical protein KCU89_g23, partial [Aureobasidium melanogenum]
MDIVTCLPYFRVKIVTTGEATIAMEKLKPPMKANGTGRHHMTARISALRRTGVLTSLTATTPQEKKLTVKHDATHTQPYPPSGGAFSSSYSSWTRDPVFGAVSVDPNICLNDARSLLL